MKVKPEAATAVVELLTMGVRAPETCWAVNKRQDNKLEKLLHLIGDLFELRCTVFQIYFIKYSECFGQVRLSIIRGISTLYTRNRYLTCQLSWLSVSMVSSILTTLADANITSMTNTYCVYTVLRYPWWWTVDLSETCRVLYQINVRNSAFRRLLL